MPGLRAFATAAVGVGVVRVSVGWPSDLQMAAQAEHGYGADHDSADEVAGQDYAPPRKPIHDRPAEQDHEQLRGRENREADAELKRRAAKREDLEWDCHVVQGIADLGHRLPDPEQPEVPMAQRLENPNLHGSD